MSGAAAIHAGHHARLQPPARPTEVAIGRLPRGAARTDVLRPPWSRSGDTAKALQFRVRTERRRHDADRVMSWPEWGARPCLVDLGRWDSDPDRSWQGGGTSRCVGIPGRADNAARGDLGANTALKIRETWPSARGDDFRPGRRASAGR